MALVPGPVARAQHCPSRGERLDLCSRTPAGGHPVCPHLSRAPGCGNGRGPPRREGCAWGSPGTRGGRWSLNVAKQSLSSRRSHPQNVSGKPYSLVRCRQACKERKSTRTHPRGGTSTGADCPPSVRAARATQEYRTGMIAVISYADLVSIIYTPENQVALVYHGRASRAC